MLHPLANFNAPLHFPLGLSLGFPLLPSLGLTVGLTLGFDAPAAAQQIVPMPVAPEVVARDDQGRTTVRATRLTQEIRLDGQLDEEVYRSVPPITGFIQQIPDEEALGSERTDA